jgi:histidine triad (HIT) family protein
MPSIFSRILTGEIPAQRIFEEDRWLAILDRYPVAPGHLLLISRHETANVADLPAAELATLGPAIARGVALLKRALGCPAVSVLIRDGREAGQEIPHVHVHLVPRIAGGGTGFASGTYGATATEADAAMAAMADRLRAAGR